MAGDAAAAADHVKRPAMTPAMRTQIAQQHGVWVKPAGGDSFASIRPFGATTCRSPEER